MTSVWACGRTSAPAANPISISLLTLILSEASPRSSLPDFREGERGNLRTCLNDLLSHLISSNFSTACFSFSSSIAHAIEPIPTIGPPSQPANRYNDISELHIPNIATPPAPQPYALCFHTLSRRHTLPPIVNFQKNASPTPPCFAMCVLIKDLPRSMVYVCANKGLIG